MVRFATTFLCLLFLSTATTAEPSTREELLARREQRKDEFGGRLNELKQRMEEHQTGLQDQGELLKLERKRQAYERKLEHLNQDIDDRHVDRLQEREELLNEMHRTRRLRSTKQGDDSNLRGSIAIP